MPSLPLRDTDASQVWTRDRDAPARGLADRIGDSLGRAVRSCLVTQNAAGAWEAAPGPRVFETALVAFALDRESDPRAALAADRARGWLATGSPQTHDMHAFLLEDSLRRLAMGERPVVDLRTPTLYVAPYRRKTVI